MEENKDVEIKVIDRRMFNPDGSLREDAIQPEAPPATSTPEAPPAQASGAAAQPQAAPAPEYDEQMDGEMPEMNEFMEFLMQIASSGFIYLGMMEHPATGTRQVNLPAARQSIDMLLLLRSKTKGNLTREEDQFFEGLLGDLQMQYVALSNRAPGVRR
ncbi:MAG TPA: DUF1844 domain-containing protein [Blastocatellia bacterium]|nr:DUF1844 domain-containing protein [Blastocatellia bacterium]